MGTYNLSADELVDDLGDFLSDREGDVSAEILAEAWNELAIENDWNDRLKAIEKGE